MKPIDKVLKACPTACCVPLSVHRNPDRMYGVYIDKCMPPFATGPTIKEAWERAANLLKDS